MTIIRSSFEAPFETSSVARFHPGQTGVNCGCLDKIIWKIELRLGSGRSRKLLTIISKGTCSFVRASSTTCITRFVSSRKVGFLERSTRRGSGLTKSPSSRSTSGHLLPAESAPITISSWAV